MIKKIYTLFKLGRKLAKSDALKIASKFNKPPVSIKILFDVLSFSFANSKTNNLNNNEGERLSESLQSMGTTFIKLGQFLATRPDIIGIELSKQLEGLQDKLPPFNLLDAKEPKFNLSNNTESSNFSVVKDYNKKIIKISEVEEEKHRAFLKSELKKNFY